MKEVDLAFTLLLPDDVADYILSVKESTSFSSEIAYYLKQKYSGAFIVTQDRLNDIVDDISDEDTQQAQNVEVLEPVGSLDLTGLEGMIRNIMNEVIKDNISLAPKISALTVENKDKKEEAPSTLDDRNIVQFEVEDSNDGEEVSEDDLDDLADMFGF